MKKKIRMNLEYENIRLKEQLTSERLKVKFLTYILESKFNLPISSILEIDDSGMLGLNSKIDRIDMVDDEVEFSVEDEPPTASPSINYFSDVNQPNDDDETLQSLLESLSKSGTLMTKTCAQIRMILDQKCDMLTMKDYTYLCQETYNLFIKNLAQRTFSKKKVCEFIESAFSPLALRLVEKYEYDITADDVTNLRKLLQNTTKACQTKFTVFNMDCTRLHNICVSVLSLHECIERLFYNNPSRKYNLIYFQNASKKTQNHLSDPFAFYRLVLVENDGTRKWQLDNRLVNTTSDFVEGMLPFCIEYFKKLYFSIFHDNVYRVNYEEKSSIAQVDCKQLMKTILTLLHPREIRKIFISVVIKNATIDAPTAKDKMDMTSDDRLFAQELYHQELVNFANVESTFNQMFDTISKVEIENITKTFSLSINY